VVPAVFSAVMTANDAERGWLFIGRSSYVEHAFRETNVAYAVHYRFTDTFAFILSALVLRKYLRAFGYTGCSVCPNAFSASAGNLRFKDVAGSRGQVFRSTALSDVSMIRITSIPVDASLIESGVKISIT